MAVYENLANAQPLQKEIHLYGSSRLGILTDFTVPPTINYLANGGFGVSYFSTFTRGEKFFELSNHLGNVLVTISDKKLAVASTTDPNLIAYYNADVATANDYYPFGSQMPGRKYSQPNSTYRYGFNGKENDKDAGEGVQDYGMRIYDSRLGRFLSVDPITAKYPELTPYQFASNSPLEGVDFDGLEFLSFHSSMYRLFNEESYYSPLTRSVQYPTIIATVYENIPTKIQNKETYGSNYQSKNFTNSGKIETGPVLNESKDAEFYGTAEDKSLQGDLYRRNVVPGGRTANAGGAAGKLGLGVGLNIWNYALPWSEQAAKDKEKGLANEFSLAVTTVDHYLNQWNGSLTDKSGKNALNLHQRADLINFVTDGSLNHNNTKESMAAALQTANFGIQLINGGERKSDGTYGKKVELQENTKKVITQLITEYKTAGGGNEFDEILK